jgi:hypothetical protein
MQQAVTFYQHMTHWSNFHSWIPSQRFSKRHQGYGKMMVNLGKNPKIFGHASQRIVMASFCLRRAAQRTCLPLFTVSTVSATFYLYGRSKRDESPRCDAAAASASPRAKDADAAVSSGSNATYQPWLHPQTDASLDFEQGMQRDLEGDFYGLFPMRQLWIPKLSYPLWDKNWDGRHPTTTGDEEKDHRMQRHLRKHGVTRHIILVRHGQYDETHKVRHSSKAGPITIACRCTPLHERKV